MSGGPPKRMSTKLAKGFALCTTQATIYGKCIVNLLDSEVKKDSCGKEFLQLKDCVKQAILTMKK